MFISNTQDTPTPDQARTSYIVSSRVVARKRMRIDICVPNAITLAPALTIPSLSLLYACTTSHQRLQACLSSTGFHRKIGPHGFCDIDSFFRPIDRLKKVHVQLPCASSKSPIICEHANVAIHQGFIRERTQQVLSLHL